MTSQGAPEDGAWKTVPVEPDDAMVEAFAYQFYSVNTLSKYLAYKEEIRAALKAALAASPSPPPGVGEPTDAVEAGKALDRLREIAYRDGAVSVTVQAADLRAFLEETQRYVIRTAKRNLVLKEAEEALREVVERERRRYGTTPGARAHFERNNSAALAVLARLGAAP